MAVLSIKSEGAVNQYGIQAAQIELNVRPLGGCQSMKIAGVLLFHDNGEIKIANQYKVAANYFDTHQAEAEALRKQTVRLPTELATRIMGLFQEFEQKSTLENQVARDADYLETAITAFGIYQQGDSKSLLDWVKNVRSALQTRSA